jgi:hypothetical protein
MGYDRLYVSTLVCGITQDGKAYCWGSEFNETESTKDDSRPSTFSQTSTITTTPLALLAGERISSLSAGQQDLCAVTTTPKVLYCWGRDKVAGQKKFTIAGGELKAGKRINLNVDPVSVAMGSMTACVLGSDRSLYCWGEDYDDKILGNGAEDILDDPTLPVVSSHCPTPGSASVPYDIVLDSTLGYGALNPGLTDTIHGIGSEQAQSEPFEKLFARMGVLRRRIEGRLRACQLSVDSPSVQNINALRNLENEINLAWQSIWQISFMTPPDEAQQMKAKGKARIEALLQQYRVTAAAPSLKEGFAQ